MLVATGRLADASGDLDGAAKAYENAIAIADGLAYTEPPYWYYPVRQSLGSVRLRQGRLDDAEKAFRDRWRACATAAGRSPGWSRSRSRRATRRPSRPRARRSSGLVRAKEGAGSEPALGRVMATASEQFDWR